MVHTRRDVTDLTLAIAPGGVRGLASASDAGAVVWRRRALLCGPVMAALVVGRDPGLMVGASVAAWWEAAYPRAWRDPSPCCSSPPSASGCSPASSPVADPDTGVGPPGDADRPPSVPRTDRAAPSRSRWMP